MYVLVSWNPSSLRVSHSVLIKCTKSTGTEDNKNGWNNRDRIVCTSEINDKQTALLTIMLAIATDAAPKWTK